MVQKREDTEREHNIQGNLKYLSTWNEAIYSDMQMALAMLENEYLWNSVEEKLELFPIL